jgi:hypothetical protein
VNLALFSCGSRNRLLNDRVIVLWTLVGPIVSWSAWEAGWGALEVCYLDILRRARFDFEFGRDKLRSFPVGWLACFANMPTSATQPH